LRSFSRNGREKQMQNGGLTGGKWVYRLFQKG